MMQFSVVQVLPESPVNTVLSPVASRRRREARFRYALFNLRIINLEFDRIQKLLKDDLVMSNDNSFSRMFFDMRHDLDRMRFYLDCGSYVSSRDQPRLEGRKVSKLTSSK